MTLLRTMIIDDEPDSISLLKLQLAKFCPQTGEVASYTSTVQAMEDINVFKPQLLFLDIEMPVMNGFEFLEKLMPVNFSVVFITAYNQYALKAFRFNALDYLVKPVDKEELIEAVTKAEHNIQPSATQLSQLQKQLRGEPVSKIAVPSQTGISFISLNDIVYCEASNNYSKLILADGSQFTISKTLKDVQDVLEESHFLRVHRQYIINLNHVKHFNRNDGVLTMVNKAELPVARNQKDKLIDMYRLL
jgi:two-component system LytT family response regulator